MSCGAFAGARVIGDEFADDCRARTRHAAAGRASVWRMALSLALGLAQTL